VGTVLGLLADYLESLWGQNPVSSALWQRGYALYLEWYEIDRGPAPGAGSGQQAGERGAGHGTAGVRLVGQRPGGIDGGDHLGADNGSGYRLSYEALAALPEDERRTLLLLLEKVETIRLEQKQRPALPGDTQ
jgi:hypothetical protein